jgi:polar amino acid transport system permease protein
MGIRYFNIYDLYYLLESAGWTILLSLLSFVFGGILGGLVTVARLSRHAFLRWLAIGYMEVMQSTPLLMQLFLWFFMLTLVGMRLPASLAAGIALTTNSSAFFADIWRGSVEAIPQTQWEASAAIGMSRFEQLFHIIVPQALRISIAPTVGLMVQIIKGTSLTALVGFVELTRAGQLVTSATFEPLKVFSVVALLYLAVCLPLSLVSQQLERRLNVGSSTRLGL